MGPFLGLACSSNETGNGKTGSESSPVDRTARFGRSVPVRRV